MPRLVNRPLGRAPKKQIASTAPKLKCKICGQMFPYNTIRDKTPAQLCGSEGCYADEVERYWEKEGYRADVHYDKKGHARLVSIKRVE